MTIRRLTLADALVQWMMAQKTVVEGEQVPLFPGVYAIFGHGNVTSLGHALEQVQDEFPTWRGQNEQGMALAAVAFAKATRAQQIMVVTTSIGPGALNMVTAAGVAMANRLPVLLLSGDTFVSRAPDPVLQQIEVDGSPSTTVNDAFRPLVTFWDRIVHPQQLLTSLPAALVALTDPAHRGPAFLALPQDAQGFAWDFPESFFESTVHTLQRLRPDVHALTRAADALSHAQRPVIIAGGGVHYSLAEGELATFAARHGVPVVETVAGRSSLAGVDPFWIGPVGVTGWDSANDVVASADVVLAIGTRLGDFVTGSGSVLSPESVVLGINTSRFDAMKQKSIMVVGDARETLSELSTVLGEYHAPAQWMSAARAGADIQLKRVARLNDRVVDVASYAQVVAAINDEASVDDYVLTASGGLPGELNMNWIARAPSTFDCEYGFSCMGYEIAGGWGAAMARRRGRVFALVGDGSYMMMNSDVFSSILSGHPMVLVVCDNGGFSVIDRLQVDQGGVSFNNLLKDCRGNSTARIDFATHAAAMGAESRHVTSIVELRQALSDTRELTRTVVLVIEVDPHAWSEGGAFWEVGYPRSSSRSEVQEAAARMSKAVLQRDERRRV
ncbi:MAG TPA: 3D-(3,5/4)-trihydroxycyclohexane-1,2-dione acylhydrolase (decyclizing) [Acidimicrobiales bacterium]